MARTSSTRGRKRSTTSRGAGAMRRAVGGATRTATRTAARVAPGVVGTTLLAEARALISELKTLRAEVARLEKENQRLRDAGGTRRSTGSRSSAPITSAIDALRQ